MPFNVNTYVKNHESDTTCQVFGECLMNENEI